MMRFMIAAPKHPHGYPKKRGGACDVRHRAPQCFAPIRKQKAPTELWGFLCGMLLRWHRQKAAKSRSPWANATPKPRPASRERAISSRRPDVIYKLFAN